MQASDSFCRMCIISDAVGATARTLASAACAQFGLENPEIAILSEATQEKQIIAFLEQQHKQTHNGLPVVVFVSLVGRALYSAAMEYLSARVDDFIVVDALGPAIRAIQRATGKMPAYTPDACHKVDDAYFKRIEALEFTIEHDDGQNPQTLADADIVLIGVSRCSKTPVSIYLSQFGLKVANIPLDPQSTPPNELFSLNPARIFGLTTTVDVLAPIRSERFYGSGVNEYASEEYIFEDLACAKRLMQRLGCVVVHTDKRAVEEIAQEILSIYTETFS